MWSDYENYLKIIREMLPVISTPEVRAKIVSILVHQVEVFPGRALVHYLIGSSHVKSLELDKNEKWVEIDQSNLIENAEDTAANPLKQKEKPGLKFLSNPGSSNLTNGRAGGI